MSSDLNFFLELEELFKEYATVGQVLSLNENQRNRVKSSKLDFDVFKYDFDLTCRFISFLSALEIKKYSITYTILVKYVFIFSSFLKNRTSLKLSAKNEILLTKATENLSSTLQIRFSNQSTDIQTAARVLISFALVNIHEICGITKLAPVNLAAKNFISDEVELESCESSLVMIASNFNDFDQIHKSLDETVRSKPFLKYTKLPRPVFKELIEDRILLIFTLTVFFIIIALITCTEIVFNKIKQ